MHNILLIGDGFVGKNLFSYFRNKYHTSITSKNILDITSNTSIYNYFHHTKFSHIIYSAGIKNIPLCETNKQLALDVNALAVLRILRNISDNIKFVYISTDYVFDGIKGAYTEHDQTNPMTFYGKSKLAGEILSESNHENTVVVRTSGIYGKYCPWIKWLLSEVDNNNSIECYIDVINSPTYALNLAEMIEDICIHTNYTGLINLSGPPLNRYDLYKSVVRAYNKNEKLLVPISGLHGFPKNISLNTDRYIKLINKFPNNINDGLKRMINYEN